MRGSGSWVHEPEVGQVVVQFRYTLLVLFMEITRENQAFTCPLPSPYSHRQIGFTLYTSNNLPSGGMGEGDKGTLL